MEVLGVAASVRVILASGSGAIHGIMELCAFFKDVSLALGRTGDLLNEVESLKNTLWEVQRLLAMFGPEATANLDEGAVVNTSNLESYVKYCAEDVAKWIKVAEDADPRPEKGLRAFFWKIKIAANKRNFEELERKISTHHEPIGISLSILGRFLDQAGVKRHDERYDKLSDKLSTGFEKMSTYHSENQRSIRSISQSISTLKSHISQLLESRSLRETDQMPNSPDIKDTEAPLHEWCCDALSGIDDAFEEHDLEQHCIYCSKTFVEGKPYLSYGRAKHLTDNHSFGSRNLTATFKSWKQLKVHLLTYHHMNNKNGNIVERFKRPLRPFNIFRGDLCKDGQPSKIELSTEDRLIMAKLLMALYNVGINENSSGLVMDTRAFQIALIWLEKIAFENNFFSEENDKLRHEIIFIVEEFIVSGYRDEQTDDKFDEIIRRYDDIRSKSFPGEKLLINETKRKQIEALGVPDEYLESCRLNKWFFQTFEESRTLRLLLRSGRVAPELGRVTSPRWVVPVIECWKFDETSTVFGKSYKSSNGAMDSRSELSSYLLNKIYKIVLALKNR